MCHFSSEQALGSSRVVQVGACFFTQHSMDERVVPLHAVGEAQERDSEDADWELAWRRMRLFPDLRGHSWIVSCLCFACTAFNTLISLGLLLSLVIIDLETKSISFLDDLVYTGVEALSAIVSIFSVGFTLYACVSRRPLLCWRPAVRGSLQRAVCVRDGLCVLGVLGVRFVAVA